MYLRVRSKIEAHFQQMLECHIFVYNTAIFIPRIDLDFRHFSSCDTIGEIGPSLILQTLTITDNVPQFYCIPSNVLKMCHIITEHAQMSCEISLYEV